MGVPSLVYELSKKLLLKLDTNKFRYFGFKKKPKNKSRFPFQIKESLDNDIPIQIVIDDSNPNLKRLKKYLLAAISLTTWITNTTKKLDKITKEDDNSLVKSIIDECQTNGWFNE